MKPRIKGLDPTNPLYRWRILNRRTLRACAKELKVSRAAMCKWETGVSVPHDINLYPLAEMIGVPADKLRRDLTARQRA